MEKILHPNPVMAWLSAAFGTVWAFIVPISGFIALLVGLIVADFITGVMAAIKEGHVIESKKMRNTVIKFSAYFIAILCSEGIRETLLVNAPLKIFEAIELTYVIVCFICLTEFKSLIENVEKITGANLWSQLNNMIDRSPKFPKDEK